MNGSTLGNFKIYEKFDYLIEINAPFNERQDRIKEGRKDELYGEKIIVERDINSEEADKKGKKKGKVPDIVIQNTGTTEDLQRIADEIYYEQIENRSAKKVETMQEKYGGYKTVPTDRTQQSNTNIKTNNKRDGLSK